MNTPASPPAGGSAPQVNPSACDRPPVEGLGQQATGDRLGTAKSEAQILKDSAREQANQAVQSVKTGASDAMIKARQFGSDLAARQKDTVVQKVDQYSEAVRAAAMKLEQEEGNPLAQPAMKAADQLQKVSRYLRDHEPMDLLHEVEGMARRRPEIAFGALFLAGFAVARFLKASGSESQKTPDAFSNDLGEMSDYSDTPGIPRPAYQPSTSYESPLT